MRRLLGTLCVASALSAGCEPPPAGEVETIRQGLIQVRPNFYGPVGATFGRMFWPPTGQYVTAVVYKAFYDLPGTCEVVQIGTDYGITDDVEINGSTAEGHDDTLIALAPGQVTNIDCSHTHGQTFQFTGAPTHNAFVHTVSLRGHPGNDFFQCGGNYTTRMECYGDSGDDTFVVNSDPYSSKVVGSSGQDKVVLQSYNSRNNIDTGHDDDCIQGAWPTSVQTGDVITAGPDTGTGPRDRCTHSWPGCETTVSSCFF